MQARLSSYASAVDARSPARPLCVCGAIVGPSPHPALGLHWGKIQKQQQKEKHRAFNRLPSPDGRGTRIVGSPAASPCHAACTQAGRCGACSHHCCRIAGKGQGTRYKLLYFCLPSSTPSVISRISLSSCLHAM